MSLENGANREQLLMMRDSLIVHVSSLTEILDTANNRSQSILASAALMEAHALGRALDILLESPVT